MGDLRFNLNEWKKWVENDLSSTLKSTLTTYEKKVQSLVKDLDLRGQEARKKGEKQLEKWTKQLKKSRTDVEKRVADLVNGEAAKLSKSFGEILKNLRAVALEEKKLATKTKAKSVKKKASKSGAPKKSRKVKVAPTVSPNTMTGSVETTSSLQSH